MPIAHCAGADGGVVNPAHSEIDGEDTNLDRDSCLKLLDLHPGFSQRELKTPYREAIRMKHPDKVAALAVDFNVFGECKMNRINRAYAKLLGKA